VSARSAGSSDSTAQAVRLGILSSCGGRRKLSSGSVREGWVGYAGPLVGPADTSAIFVADFASVKVNQVLVSVLPLQRTAWLFGADPAASAAASVELRPRGRFGGLGRRLGSAGPVGFQRANGFGRPLSGASRVWGPLLRRRSGQIVRSDRAAGWTLLRFRHGVPPRRSVWEFAPWPASFREQRFSCFRRTLGSARCGEVLWSQPPLWCGSGRNLRSVDAMKTHPTERPSSFRFGGHGPVLSWGGGMAPRCCSGTG
jgi:hypothetical protein